MNGWHNNNYYKESFNACPFVFYSSIDFSWSQRSFLTFIISRSWLFNICSINVFDSFFLAGVFFYIERVHLHFDNVCILYKTHVWKVHQTSNECKLYILASKSTECCLCISTLYSESPSFVIKKEKMLMKYIDVYVSEKRIFPVSNV